MNEIEKYEKDNEKHLSLIDLYLELIGVEEDQASASEKEVSGLDPIETLKSRTRNERKEEKVKEDAKSDERQSIKEKSMPVSDYTDKLQSQGQQGIQEETHELQHILTVEDICVKSPIDQIRNQFDTAEFADFV